jgi:hypothetical protein
MPLFLRWLLELGPTNPIAVRLVASGSRRARHHYIRIAYLGVMIIVLLWALLIRAGGDELTLQQLAAAGSNSFQLVAFLQIALICILAPVITYSLTLIPKELIGGYVFGSELLLINGGLTFAGLLIGGRSRE